MRVLKPGGELDLAAESLRIYSGCKIRKQDFNNDFSSECDLLGEKYSGHPAAAELTLNDVGVTKGSL